MIHGLIAVTVNTSTETLCVLKMDDSGLSGGIRYILEIAMDRGFGSCVPAMWNAMWRRHIIALSTCILVFYSSVCNIFSLSVHPYHRLLRLYVCYSDHITNLVIPFRVVALRPGYGLIILVSLTHIWAPIFQNTASLDVIFWEPPLCHNMKKLNIPYKDQEKERQETTYTQ